VVVRQVSGLWQAALIEPQKEGSAKPRKRARAILTLPKGLVDPGETAQAAAIREVREETGLVAQMVAKLADIKYVYTRNWGDGARVFKVVSFYLLRYTSGEIDADITPDMRVEVRRAVWVPLAEAAAQLAYGNERKVVRLAQEYVDARDLKPGISTKR